MKLCVLAVPSTELQQQQQQQQNSIVPNREHKERSENWSVRYCGTGNRRFHLWKRVQKSASQHSRKKEHEGGCPQLSISKPASSFSRQTNITVSCLSQAGEGRYIKETYSEREPDARRTRRICHNSRLWPDMTVAKVMVNH